MKKSITIVSIDTDPVSHPITKFAVQKTLRCIDVNDLIFFGQSPLYIGESFVKIQRFDSTESYSEFVLKCLWPFISTDFLLIVHWDGFAFNPSMWSDEFFDFDYIGAPWAFVSDAYNVGNGGFSLRSKSLIEMCKSVEIRRHPEVPQIYGGAEDVVIGRIYRAKLESMGIKFPPTELAEDFSFETGELKKIPFGFHGPMNMPLFMTESELISLSHPLSEKIKPGIIRDVFVQRCKLLGYAKFLEYFQ